MKQPDIWTKLGFSAVIALVLGVWSWRQYLKYADGRGLALWLLPTGASMGIQLVVFVLVPAGIACWVGCGLAGKAGSPQWTSGA